MTTTVKVIYSEKREVESEIFRILRRKLREIVAQALTTSNMQLCKEDVSTIFTPGKLYYSNDDFNIIVFVKDSPERKRNVLERSERIAKELGELFSSSLPSDDKSVHGSVLIFLPGADISRF